MRSVIRAYRRTLPSDRRHLLERFHYAHAARKVVGVGSVGTRAWIVLMLGNDDADPLFLQFKEAQASVLEPYLGKSKFAHPGQRVVEGQRLMQAASDIMLGWFRTHRRRRRRARLLHPAAVGRQGLGAGRGDGTGRDGDVRASSAAGRWPRRTLAPATPSAIGAYLGSGDAFDRAMAAFAEAYADQNERDYAALREAAESGRVAVETGL